MATLPGQRPLTFDGTATPTKTALFLILCAGWILPGLIGHDPWKPDEAYTFGLIYHIIQTGDWVVPTLAGEPFVEKPPLYFIFAALVAKLFSWWLPLHDAARLSTGLIVVATLFACAATIRVLVGERFTRIGVLILIGCLGWQLRAHEMITDIALHLGFALGYLGFALSRKRPVLGGVWLGLGVGVGFMSKGLVAPGLLGVIALALPAVSPAFRSREYVKALAVSLLVMAPFLGIWPYALYERSPTLFHEWFMVNNIDRFTGNARLGFTNEPLYYFHTLLWYAWPALPLAAWAVWKARGKLLAWPEYALPLVAFVVLLVLLSFAGESREVYAMPMLIPLTLLGVQGVDSLKRGAAAALDFFGVFFFGLVSIAIWITWLALYTGVPRGWARWLERWQPGFHDDISWLSVALAALITLIWAAVILNSRRNNRRAIVNWSAGVASTWLLVMTLLLPYIDHGKGYKATFATLTSYLPAQRTCVASYGLGEPQRALLDYHHGLRTERLSGALDRGVTRCNALIVQDNAPKLAIRPAPPWREVWQGSRPGDKGERLYVFVRGW